MSSTLPTSFSDYQDILRMNRRSKRQANNEDGDNENGQGPDSFFNQSFEDVKEIQQDGFTLTVIKTQSVFRKENERRGRFGEFSLLLRRTMDIKSQARPKVQLEIQSDRLRAAFAVLASNLTTIRLSHDPIIIPEPYMEIYYCRHRIRDAVNIAGDNPVGGELKLLVDFEQEYMAETIKTVDQFKVSGYIEFEWLWALFPPGELVVIENRSASSTPIQWCAVIKTFNFRRLDSGVTIWTITVTHTGFNGVRFGTVETSMSFPSFSNNMPISRLAAYPLQFCKNPDLLKQEAIRRGTEYEKYCMASSRQKEKPIGTPLWHDGPVWTEREPGNDDRRGCRIIDNPSNTVKGRSIVDFEGFFANSPAFRESLVPDNNPDDDDDESDDGLESYMRRSRRMLRRTVTDGSLSGLGSPLTATSLSEGELLTCPPLVPIFSLAVRQWCLAFIGDLGEIRWNPDTFDQLQVDSEIKEAIQGLVRGYSTHATVFDDFIANKGRGLVFLLHGPPGCGKTMTAESISESLKKPLYHVSGGELGSSVSSIQHALESAFELAARWDTILLLDEADAFLAKRDGADIARNSLIAVFLRLLEYQSGIIFLTTNRLGDFDEAFESRIHLQIPFSPLDAQKRRLIWERLALKNGNCILSNAQTEALGRLPLDGRRIKNILRLASLFAANRSRSNGTAKGGQDPMDHDKVELTMAFGDIRKVLPLAITRVGNEGESPEEKLPMAEDLSQALADLMEGARVGE